MLTGPGTVVLVPRPYGEGIRPYGVGIGTVGFGRLA